VFALAAIRAVVVRVIDVRECGGLELGIFHVRTLTPGGCGLLLYKSYSICVESVLYKADAAKRDTERSRRRTGWTARMDGAKPCRENICGANNVESHHD
jgi:hypothetical protein